LTKNNVQVSEIIEFWFEPPMSDHWFSSTPEIDKQITATYEELWEQAQQGELKEWENDSEGCLALCILLDQLPLNMFRGTAKSFSTEQQAVAVSKQAIKKGLDKDVAEDKVAFLYMPLMHSENFQDQELCVQSFANANLEGNHRFAKHHRDLIKEFGRFPHRNDLLGRESTPAEIEYLQSDRAFTG